jgi:AcrR family transcriptional regulator
MHEIVTVGPWSRTEHVEVALMASRRTGPEDSKTRSALLDAAEQLMLEEGYAAVSSRRVAGRAGMNAALVYYYFDTMEELFRELFRRRAELILDRQAEAMSSEQPLWALWDLTHDQSNTALNLEFMALGNHRKAIRAEIASYSKKFRRVQLDALTGVLGSYGIDPDVWPPSAVILFMTGISRFLLMEEAYGLDIGHEETIAIIERHIYRLEGERRSSTRRTLARQPL